MSAEPMPSFSVMSKALECLMDKSFQSINISFLYGEEGEYSSLPVFAMVYGQPVKLLKLNFTCSLKFENGNVYDNGKLLVGEEKDVPSMSEHIRAIQMWFLNPWRSLSFYSYNYWQKILN